MPVYDNPIILTERMKHLIGDNAVDRRIENGVLYACVSFADQPLWLTCNCKNDNGPSALRPENVFWNLHEVDQKVSRKILTRNFYKFQTNNSMCLGYWLRGRIHPAKSLCTDRTKVACTSGLNTKKYRTKNIVESELIKLQVHKHELSFFKGWAERGRSWKNLEIQNCSLRWTSYHHMPMGN